MGQLETTAKKLVAPGKGILAADESFATIAKRFKAIGIASTAESRMSYREMLFTTPEVSDFLSGVILFDETSKQTASDGRELVDILAQNGIIPGIKVDTGAKALALYRGEKVTEGLDGLRERLTTYYELGARFAKWRAVIMIAGTKLPTSFCIEANAHALARYAALCQEQGLVPIVEPEVLMDGDHSLERCSEVTGQVLQETYRQLEKQRVDLTGTLLKPNMVIAAKDCSQQEDVAAVASRTIACLRENVPASVPGIVFLSGGQSEVQATTHLNAMNKEDNLPWQLSFSYGRALQNAALQTWAGQSTNIAKAQQVFHKRCRLNSLARRGEYRPQMEQ